MTEGLRENKKVKTNSGIYDTCAYLVYDEEYEEYICDVNMDEDDYARISYGGFQGCPYYRSGDEYRIARKQ